MFEGELGDNLQTVQGSGETAIKTRPGASEMMSDNRARTARSEGVRPGRSMLVGIGKQRQHAPASVVSQGVQVAHPLVGWGGVELEIPGMDDGAQWGCQGERPGFDGAVGKMDEFHLEGADIKGLAGLHFYQTCAVCQAVLLEFGASQRQREGRAVNRCVHFVEQIGEPADVVLVRVRQYYGPESFPVLPNISKIRHHDVDAQQFSVGKHDAAIDHDHVSVVLVGHHIHPELAHTAEGDGLQLSIKRWNIRPPKSALMLAHLGVEIVPDCPLRHGDNAQIGSRRVEKSRSPEANRRFSGRGWGFVSDSCLLPLNS